MHGLDFGILGKNSSVIIDSLANKKTSQKKLANILNQGNQTSIQKAFLIISLLFILPSASSSPLSIIEEQGSNLMQDAIEHLQNNEHEFISKADFESVLEEPHNYRSPKKSDHDLLDDLSTIDSEGTLFESVVAPSRVSSISSEDQRALSIPLASNAATNDENDEYVHYIVKASPISKQDFFNSNKKSGKKFSSLSKHDKKSFKVDKTLQRLEKKSWKIPIKSIALWSENSKDSQAPQKMMNDLTETFEAFKDS